MADVYRLALVVLVSFVPHAAQAQADRLFASYAIDWEGLHIGAFETELASEPGRYTLSYEARSEGVIGWLFPFISQGSSTGARTATAIMPERYQVGSSFKDRDRAWSVTFGADGQVTHVDIPQEDLRDRDPVPQDLRVAPDPLALMLWANTVAAPGVEQRGRSFDGKRALELELVCAPTLVAFHDAPAGAAIAAESEALTCTVDGQLAAGASQRFKGRTMRDADREPARIWLQAGIVEQGFWPVRVEAQTGYGTVTAELVELKHNDQAPSH